MESTLTQNSQKQTNATKAGTFSKKQTDEKKVQGKQEHRLTQVSTDNEFEIKHPLQFGWSWWYDNPNTSKTTQATWNDNLKKIYTFSTVEDFWCLWNNIKGAKDLPPGSNYHVFKDGIEPCWEDLNNKCGGKWIIQLKSSQRSTQLEQLWMWAVLACIGNSFEDEDEVCGVVVSVRKQTDKICLWTRNATEEAKTRRIGQQLKDLLGLQIKIEYQVHEDAMVHNSSFNNKAKYEV